MRREPVRDMPDSVYFEDIRWKHAALRPILGEDVKRKIQQLNAKDRVVILAVFDMQKQFDWQQYYAAEKKLQTGHRQKNAQLNSAELPA